MINCGITGHRGNLGKKFQVVAKNFKFKKFKGDIRKVKDVEEWIEKENFDLIIHFAAIVPISVVNKKYNDAIKVNYLGTKNLVDAILKHRTNLKWFFYSSTSHVYKYSKKKIKESSKLEPISRYGKTKLMGENYIIKKLKNKKIKFCIGRIFSIIDNKNKEFFLKGLIRKIKVKDKLIKIENLNHYRDFVSTDQVSKAILLLWRKKHHGIINIASGKKTNLKDIARVFAKKNKKKIFFNNNVATSVLANIKKLKKYGWRQDNLNFVRYFQ